MTGAWICRSCSESGTSKSSMLLEHVYCQPVQVVTPLVPNGMRTVDHFKESGINPATRPLNAITHETVDHFLSLLLGCLLGKISPKTWIRDVSEAFRRVSTLSESQELCCVVFGHQEDVWVSQHISVPFHRIGCLLKDIMVSIFLTPCCRYVDDFFGVDPAGCEYTGGFCFSQVCSSLGFPTDPKKNTDNGTNLTILGTRVEVETVTETVVEKWSKTLRSIQITKSFAVLRWGHMQTTF